MVKSQTFIASPPGATIKEHLADRGMTQKEFALRMDMTEKHISKLINGEVHLTPDVALRLEMVIGIPARFWSNLEAAYREKLSKVIAENEMEEDIQLAKKFPYNEMAKYEWVAKTKVISEKVFELRKFFEVVRLSLVEMTPIPGIACRWLAEHEKADFALFPWAQKARLESRKIETNPINLANLRDIIPEIKLMTNRDPQVFCTELRIMLSQCGIAIVFLPHIGGSFLHGATFYDGRKIVMGLTVRGKDADRFWFSLFHEIGHILLGHIGQATGTSSVDETEADKFARETLIPTDLFDFFIAQEQFSKNSIIEFAKRLEIHPGIVVGRLQKEGYIKYSWHNDLKTKYIITA